MTTILTRTTHQWVTLTQPEPVEAHLNLDKQAMAALRKEKGPVVLT
jgi:hypothetical protein